MYTYIYIYAPIFQFRSCSCPNFCETEVTIPNTKDTWSSFPYPFMVRKNLHHRPTIAERPGTQEDLTNPIERLWRWLIRQSLGHILQRRAVHPLK